MNRYNKINKSLFGLLFVLTFILNCNPQKPVEKEQKSNKETFWETSTPEEQGLNSSLLFDMLEEIQDNELRIRSVIIIKNGYLVLESYIHPYDNSILHDVKSVSKSVISSLTGIALRENIIKSLDQNVYDFFPEYSSIPKRYIRQRHIVMLACVL